MWVWCLGGRRGEVFLVYFFVGLVWGGLGQGGGGLGHLYLSLLVWFWGLERGSGHFCVFVKAFFLILGLGGFGLVSFVFFWRGWGIFCFLLAWGKLVWSCFVFILKGWGIFCLFGLGEVDLDIFCFFVCTPGHYNLTKCSDFLAKCSDFLAKCSDFLTKCSDILFGYFFSKKIWNWSAGVHFEAVVLLCSFRCTHPSFRSVGPSQPLEILRADLAYFVCNLTQFCKYQLWFRLSLLFLCPFCRCCAEASCSCTSQVYQHISQPHLDGITCSSSLILWEWQ